MTPPGTWIKRRKHSGERSGVFVEAEWLHRWWYAVPAVPAVAALLRLTLLAPEI
jgi:hypothetical protein